MQRDGSACYRNVDHLHVLVKLCAVGGPNDGNRARYKHINMSPMPTLQSLNISADLQFRRRRLREKVMALATMAAKSIWLHVRRTESVDSDRRIVRSCYLTRGALHHGEQTSPE